MAILKYIITCFTCVALIYGVGAQSDDAIDKQTQGDSIKVTVVTMDSFGFVRQPRHELLHHLFQYDNADRTITLLLQSIHAFDSRKDSAKANVYREDIARVYVLKKYYREALFHFNILLRYHLKRNNLVEAGVMRGAIADTYVTLDSLRLATPLYRIIEELNSKEPDSLLAEMHDASVTALTRQGYAIAGLTDTTEVDFGGLIDNPPGFQALCLLNSGHRYFARKEYAMARYYYLKCLAEEHLDEVIRRDATYKLSKIYRALNQWGKAYEYLEKYSFINDSLINDRRQRVIDKLLVTNQTFEQKSKIRELEKDQKITAFQNRLQSVLTFSLLFGSVIVLIGAYFTIRNYQHRFNANQIIHRQTMEINRQRITELENNVKIESMNSMIQGQEAERERVAKDLHDSLGGLLSTVKLHFDALQSQETRIGKTPEYQKAYSLLDDACKEVRHISNNLQPGALHKLGLVPAIQDLIHRVRTVDGPTIKFSHNDVDSALDVRISLNVYRIVQELLNNALKHAEAGEISINLTQSDETLSVSVDDDGKGYDISATTKMGMGTENIASRVNYLKGDLSIHSVLDEGTTTQIEIPLKN